ncbi:MAG: CusA/CzcA family heavy metal efflux RND transporter, partial [Candidatus Eisenbacteria bacterium]|nr:CusA/CzcA family heavy metal efflux RND transporter [Candidatus Latescibacterota bacterium]MBD3302121.1 CusA/CzcA family heavy metal efflux RND transporter [Candidatus Eisenbacteria bacterium]
MLSKLIEGSIRYRWAVIALTGILVVVGVISLRELPIDAFPDTTPVLVQINTDVPSLSPLEIEAQVTFPIEQEIAGLPGLEEVRSISKFGLSQVTAIFEEGVDLYFARYLISERLQAVELPDGIPRPTLGPVATGLGEIFHYRIVGDGRTIRELRTIHDWIIKPQLRSVAGIAEVNTWGGEERQVQVVIDPQRLLKYDLTFQDVFAALERNNRNVGGGIVSTGEAQLVQGAGILTSRSDVARVIVAARDGVPIRLEEIAVVRDGAAIRRGAVTAEGEGETVLGLAFMLMGENSHEVAGLVRERIEQIEPSLPDGVRIVPVYDRTDLVDEVLHT